MATVRDSWLNNNVKHAQAHVALRYVMQFEEWQQGIKCLAPLLCKGGASISEPFRGVQLQTQVTP
jgi:hypothetical protein